MAESGHTSRQPHPGAAQVGRSARMLAGGAIAFAVLLGAASTVRAGEGPQSAADAVATVSLSSRVTPATLGLGGGFSDAATLTAPPGGPPPSGTVTFRVYGPADPNCTGPVVFSSTNTLAGATTPSSSFTPPSPGTYEVIAIYSGDTNYGSVATACGDPAEVAVVGLGPTLTGLSPSSGPAGGLDTVTITGSDLTGASTVNFGGVPTLATVIGSTEVIATAPAGSGSVNVTVTTPFGTTPIVPADVYTYAAAAPAGLPSTVIVTAIAAHPPVVETGSTTKITTSTARFTGTVDTDGLVGSARFEYTVRLSGGASITGRTADRPVGVLGALVTADVAGLLPDSRYRVRLVATNAAGITVGAATSFTTAASRSPARPVLGRTFNATPISGLVDVRLPGAGQPVTPLTDARHLPVGTTLDTRHGAVRLTVAATSPGTDRSGSFSGGTFTVSQTSATRGLAELRLVRASTARRICAPSGAQTALGLVRAVVTGRFEVRGRYGSATGSAATWTTTDRCDGLSAAVAHGLVEVSDPGRGRTVAVHGGSTYLTSGP
ncbi:MAG TPA: IPT/TIG domain-containing protein [Solirubrobacteraceae bacterium]